MRTRSWVLLVAVIVLAAGPVAAQDPDETGGPGAGAAPKAEEESLTCDNGTQSSGAGEKLFQTCVSDTGSVPLFRTRAGGGDNIDSDGYMICDDQAGGEFVSRAYSRGSSENNLAFPTTATATSNVRTTNDGRYRLSQNFARDATKKEMVITMTLKNLGPGAVADVRLQRFVDIDADGSTGNIFLRGADSIVAVTADNGRGMVFGTLTPEITHTTGVTTYADFDDGTIGDFDDCFVSHGVATPTADADHVAYISFALGNLAQGAAKTVKVYYRKY